MYGQLKIQKFNFKEFDSISEAEKVALNYLNIYRYNISQVISSFKNLALMVDCSEDSRVENLARLIKIKLNKGLQKPLKILINNPTNRDMIEFKQKLVMMFGIVVVNLENLLTANVNNKTVSGKEIVDALNKNLSIPENVILDVIEERIEKVDCRINGFAIDMGVHNPMILASGREMSFNIVLTVNESGNEMENERIKTKIKSERFLEFKMSETPEDCLHKVFFEISHYYD